MTKRVNQSTARNRVSGIKDAGEDKQKGIRIEERRSIYTADSRERVAFDRVAKTSGTITAAVLQRTQILDNLQARSSATGRQSVPRSESASIPAGAEVRSALRLLNLRNLNTRRMLVKA